MRKLVLFDIDGTIMHNGGAGRDAMEHALQTVFGTTGSAAYRYDGKTDKQIVRELMRLEGHDDAWIDERMERVTHLYIETLRKTLAEPGRDIGMFEGVADLVNAVDARDDAVLGLLTGNIEAGARLKLRAVGLDVARFVINAFGSDHEVRGELPAVACRRMREQLGVDLPGNDVIVIGDTPADIHCGRDIGARAIGVATGRYTIDELREHEPFAVFETLRDTQAVMQVIYA